MQRKRGLDLIVIDYIGLMKGQGDNRVQEIGSISRGLKALAKELSVPILALAQLNRGVESRPDKRPIMSDLRDSGEIEQDADIIAMLHREALYTEAAEWANYAELILRKNRNGPLGDVSMHYDGRLMTFTPWQGDSPRHATAARKYASKGFREE
ncbi:MAG: DnaB-like helicase C-terminal domain-containing protein [Betaproteobacteria bacterium]|nr:DnaB-like helicase C-terminal domain-containing protein [Betaproteobacteria bacterium]